MSPGTVRGGRRRLALVGLAALVFGSGPLTATETVVSATGVPGDGVVATVEGESISADAVRRALVRAGGGAPDRLRSSEDKVDALETLLRVHVLASAAEAAGYADDPEVREAIRQLLAERFWRDLANGLELTPVSEDEVGSWYKANLDRFTEPERRRGAVLTLRAADGSEVDTRLEPLLGEARSGSSLDFEALVRRHSEDPVTRRVGGDLGFVVSGASVFRVAPELVDALFALEEVGEVAVVRAERFTHLLRLSAVEGGAPLPLEVVASEIRRLLTAERRDQALAAAYAELRSEAEIEIDLELLERIGPSDLSEASRPPSFPLGDRP